MVVLEVAFSKDEREKICSFTIGVQFVIILAEIVLFVMETCHCFQLSKYDIWRLLEDELSFVSYKGIIVNCVIISNIVFHAYQLRLLSVQQESYYRLSIKNLIEFIMYPATSIVLVFFCLLLSIAFSTRLETATAVGLLKKMELYDTDISAHQFVDKIQGEIGCCGIHSFTDYYDLSEIRLPNSKNWIKQPKTIKSCEGALCTLPISCCSALDCSNFPSLLKENEHTEFQERWYKHNGCQKALINTNFGFLQNNATIYILAALLILEIVNIILLQFCLSSYCMLKEANLTDEEVSIGWLLPFGSPTPVEIIQDRMDRPDCSFDQVPDLTMK